MTTVARGRLAVLAAAAGLLAVLAAGPAAATDSAVTLSLGRPVAKHGASVTFTGAVTPAARTRVEIYAGEGAARLLVAGESSEDGNFSLSATVREPAAYVAHAGDAVSAPVALRIEPLLEARLRGERFVGAELELAGRLAPARAGRVVLRVRGQRKSVRVERSGRFRAQVPSGRPGRLDVALSVRARDGYVDVRVERFTRLAAPRLAQGATGPAVRFVERRLRALGYALRGVDGLYALDTREAVYAFQKVEGLPVDGVVGARVWRELAAAHTPPAAVRRGDHVEVDKGRQLLYEVRSGRVVRIVHVSTGATGNTPLGTWRVYWKLPSFNAIGMYYSLFFLRGFAIHGYHSVPTYPASHGCIRTPLWFAPGLFARWPAGATIHVLPTTARG